MDLDLNITKIDIETLIKKHNFINGVKIIVVNNRVEKVLPPNMVGLNYRIWKNNPGGVIQQDIINYLKTSKSPEYFIIKNDTINYLIRLITSDEKIFFSTRGLIHGKLKDADYMIIKDLNESHPNYVKTCEYIDQKHMLISDNDESDSQLNIPLTNEASSDHNITLFED